MILKWVCVNDESYSDCMNIRKEVFINEQKIDEKEEFDGTDLKYNSNILILYKDEKPFATGRLININNDLFIGRVAVLKQYRGLNYGKILMEKLIDYAKNNFENKEVFVNAQCYAKKFYEKLGFKQEGDEFLEAGILHIKMKLDLKR